MTALGSDAPNAVGLVYIAAFGLDEGESIRAAFRPPAPALAHLEFDERGSAWLPEDDFVNHFAADVDPIKARVMFAIQQPVADPALADVMGAISTGPSYPLKDRLTVVAGREPCRDHPISTTIQPQRYLSES
jgi:hypothetical protein